MNETGVIGGNAAIFTRSLHDPDNRGQPGLTGMELLRLGLERGSTAESALQVIVDLLEKYGQWGSAVRGTDHEKGSYDNSFLLADKTEAWVLETSGRRWVAECVKNGIRTISNEPSIRRKWDKASADLKEYAACKGWWNPEEQPFDFAYCYGDHEHYSRQVSHIRWKRSKQLLDRYRGAIDCKTVMRVLRDHYEETFLEGPQFHRFLPDFHTLCMHDSPAGFTWGNTATSVVIDLDPTGSLPPVFWIAYLPPCSSVYTALPFGSFIPEPFKNCGKTGLQMSDPTGVHKDEYDNKSLWWRLHRLVTKLAARSGRGYGELRHLFDEIESKHITQVQQLRKEKLESAKEVWKQSIVDNTKDFLDAIEEIEEKLGLA
jgi:secernin